jgi:hypothetical protein
MEEGDSVDKIMIGLAFAMAHLPQWGLTAEEMNAVGTSRIF